VIVGAFWPPPKPRILVGEVDELANVLARLKRRTDELGAGRFGRSLMKMGFPHSMTTTILPRVIRDFLAETTSVSLELVPIAMWNRPSRGARRTSDLCACPRRISVSK
jgi:hypothetical protein